MLYITALALVTGLYLFLCSLFWVGVIPALGISLTILAAPLAVWGIIWIATFLYTWLVTKFSKTEAPTF